MITPSRRNQEGSIVVTFNVGSATLKMGVYRKSNLVATTSENNLQFSVNIDLRQAVCRWKGIVPQDFDDFTVTSAQESALSLLDRITNIYNKERFIFVHRVVHGEHHSQPIVISSKVLAELHDLANLAPLHQPPALAIIDAIDDKYNSSNFIQIAAFDTAFHAKRPRLWYEYALPKKLRDEGIRSYGFHGLSYQSIMRRLKNHRPDLVGKRLIIAHLGSGCSITSIVDGHSVNSTLGFSGLDGVPMGTRSGELDPGVILYLMEKGWSHQDITQCLYKESGLLGLSDISNDVRELSESQDKEAKFTLAYFSAHVAKAISGLLPSLQGVDAIVFTAGIGEHQANIREQVIEHLAFLNIHVDTAKNNNVDLNTIHTIHSESSETEVLVIATDEQYELFMAANAK